MEVRYISGPADEGRVIAQGFGDYEIIVAEYPGQDAGMCYGIYNKTTQIVEAYTNMLAKAKYLAQAFNDADKAGYKEPANPFDAAYADYKLPGEKAN